jgi:nicotinate-nucleotide adenylyltransferase
MLQLALRACPECEICTVEIDRPGPAYTVDTLQHLHDQAPPSASPSGNLRLLLGSDAVLTFPRWRSAARILKLATPAVILRPPHDRHTFVRALNDLFGSREARRWESWIVETSPMEIDATHLRARLASGDMCPGMIDPDVAKYAIGNHLYGGS